MVTTSRRVRWVGALGLLLVVMTLGALVWWRLGTLPTPDPAAAPRTAFSDLTPATGPPMLPSLETARPGRGDVVQAAGPFDDRFRLRDLAFDGASVVGVAEITSDVSELLELEVVAGFYDRAGRLVGTGRYVHHPDHGTGHEEGDGHQHGAGHEGESSAEQSQAFRIEVPPSLRRVAVGAAVGVPVLVNE